MTPAEARVRQRGPEAKPPEFRPAVPFLATWHELFDEDALWAAARSSGAVRRARSVDIAAFIEANVLAVSNLPGVQTTAQANYIGLMGKAVAPSSFYDRYTEEFATLMAEVSRRATLAVRAVAPLSPASGELDDLFERFDDVTLADSTCQLLKRMAEKWAPSTSRERPASFKLHAIVSLRDALPVETHVSPQRRNDNPELRDEQIAPGTLFLADLGYVDHARYITIKRRGAHFVTRLKSGQDPLIKKVHIGKGDRRKIVGMRVEEALATGALDFHDDELDLDVEIEASRSGVVERETFRLVGLHHDAEDGKNGDRYYLTTVERDVFQVGHVYAAYRLRWEIELTWKHLKTGVGLSALRAWKKAAVMALVHAKLTALALSRLLELALAEERRAHAMGQAAIVLALNRAIPMLLMLRARGQNIDILEMERRILLIAATSARSRNRRRDRKRAQERDFS